MGNTRSRSRACCQPTRRWPLQRRRKHPLEEGKQYQCPRCRQYCQRLTCPHCADRHHHYTRHPRGPVRPATCHRCKKQWQDLFCAHCNAALKLPGASYKINSLQPIRCPAQGCGRSTVVMTCPSCLAAVYAKDYKPGQVVECTHCTNPFQRARCPSCFKSISWAAGKRTEGGRAVCPHCSKHFQLVNCPECSDACIWPNADYVQGAATTCRACNTTWKQAVCHHCFTSNRLPIDYVPGTTVPCTHCAKPICVDVNGRNTVPGTRAVQGNVRKVAPAWELSIPDDAPYCGARVRVVEPGSKEYRTVASQFQSTCGKRILRIEHVENGSLLAVYEGKKLAMVRADGTANEQWLWHGTTAAAAKSINAQGFKRDFAGKNAAKYGDGVYFARSATFSTRPCYSPLDKATGERRIYLARVCVGKLTVGTEGIRVPPVRDAKTLQLFDSTTNSLQTLSVIVAFHDAQAYPEYCVVFSDKTHCDCGAPLVLPGTGSTCLACDNAVERASKSRSSPAEVFESETLESRGEQLSTPLLAASEA